jgi:hypothetical protein
VFLVVALDSGFIRVTAVNGNLLGNPMTADGFLQKSECCLFIAVLCEQEVNGLALLIYRTVDVTDCNRNDSGLQSRHFWDRIICLYPSPRTALNATEIAIIRPGLQSTVWGPHYLQLYALTVFGPSFLAVKRLRIWRVPRRFSCLVRL